MNGRIGKPTFFIIIGIVILLSGSAMAKTSATTKTSPKDTLKRMEYNGKLRGFLVHIPAHMDTDSKAPLLLVFHGLGGSGVQMRDLTKIEETADKYGFITVFPDALCQTRINQRIWNARGNDDLSDDVGFINALLDYLIDSYGIDSKRIFATGTSNGGMFSYRLLCELSHRITAIAVNAAVDVFEGSCPNFVPRSILHIHSVNDPLVPIKGKKRRFFELPSVANTFKKWQERLDCYQAPKVVLEDSLQLVKRYSHCKCSSEILYYMTKDGGHGWPGSKPKFHFAMKTSSAFDMNELILSFFNGETLP
ncbi:MAG: PHB depolymerase family esterase [Bacteroidota bacterium]